MTEAQARAAALMAHERSLDLEAAVRQGDHDEAYGHAEALLALVERGVLPEALEDSYRGLAEAARMLTRTLATSWDPILGRPCPEASTN